MNLADNGIDPKIVIIVKEMQSDDKENLTELLRQYKDVFLWSFEDMKGLDVAFCQHQINLNLSYGVKVKEEINKLVRVGFIPPVKRATWLSPIVVVPKKNG